MTNREKVAVRLKTEFNIEIDPTSWHVTHAGKWERSSGACSSYVYRKNSFLKVAFYASLREYLRKGVSWTKFQMFDDVTGIEIQ